MTFGDRVRALRLEIGISQAEFANFVPMSRSYLSEIERKVASPSSGMIRAIVRAFDDMDVGLNEDEVRYRLGLVGDRPAVPHDELRRRAHGRLVPA